MMRSYTFIFAVAIALSSFRNIDALQLSDIPSECNDNCREAVSLLNRCGLQTSGNNANQENRKCFCDSISSAGYAS